MPETGRPRFALAYTTARPPAIAAVLDLWFGRAREPALVTAVVSVDTPDLAGAQAALAGSPWRARATLVENRGPRTCVAGWNAAARASEGDVVVAVSDDVVPPEGWDDAVARSAPPGWWRLDRVVAVGDGNITDVLTQPMVTRPRLERFGYLYHPAYLSLFCDTELTAVAYLEGAVINARHLLFEHRHHDIGKRERDAVDRRHSSPERWRAGQRLFEARQQAGYPREPLDGPPPPTPLGPTLAFAVHVLAARDSFCLRETVASIARQGLPGEAEIRSVYLHCPDELWNGTANPEANLREVEAVAASLRRDFPGLVTVAESLPVGPHREAGGRGEELEARVRNAALARIRRDGHGHVLVADSDELWRAGTLRRIARQVRRSRPASLTSLMLPVVGLPGYPVDRARDRATVYLAPNACFVECRTSCAVEGRVAGRNVVHFTATRRTMDEIARKHRESGHYQNADYDFEGWIRDVLPGLGPGYRGAHMYRPKQIWPLVRRWSHREWSEIPGSLHPYLGRETQGWPMLLLRRLGASLRRPSRPQAARGRA